MPNLTPNYSFKKPLQIENYNVDDFNGNMDILDTKLKELDISNSNKIIKPNFATNLNIAIFDSNKNVTDSGKKISDLERKIIRGELNITDTIPANGTIEKVIQLGENFKKGSAFICNNSDISKSIITYFNDDNLKTTATGYFYNKTNEQYSGGCMNRNKSGLITDWNARGGFGSFLVNNSFISLHIQEIFIENNNTIKIVFLSKWLEPKPINVFVSWEVER